MHAEFKRDIGRNYLILESEEEINTSSYQVRMLAGNVIPSLLRMRLQNLDGKLYFYYDITSRQALASYFEDKKFTAEDIRMIFRGIAEVMEQMGDYLMNPEYLLFCPEYVYMDVEKKELSFCCFPSRGREVHAQMRDLMEYMLPKLDHEDPEAVLLGYGIYRKLLEPGFQMDDIKEAVYQREKTEDRPEDRLEERGQERTRASGEKSSNPFPDHTPKDNPGDPDRKEEDKKTDNRGAWKIWAAGCAVSVLLMSGIMLAGAAGLLPAVPAELIMGCGIAAFGAGGFASWAAGKKRQKEERDAVRNREYFSPEFPAEAEKPEEEIFEHIPEPEISGKEQEGMFGETEALFSMAARGPASLVSREPGELATIYLDQEFTVVGKLAGAADAVVPVPTVSRVHARIRKKDGEYFLADLNSRNGTSVNGQMLKNEEEYRLQDEDEVDFAQARYIFVK